MQDGAPRGVLLLWLGAWAIVLGAEAGGLTRYLDHDALLHSGTPAWTGVILFLTGWLVMVAAMMLPATRPALGQIRGRAGGPSSAMVGGYLAGFALTWVLAGSAALGFDMMVHRAVDAVPPLGARPWLVLVALLAAAGAVQLAPSTRRKLDAARRPDGNTATTVPPFAVGRLHGVRCLRVDGPLMLVMFALGGSLGAMAILTAVMAGERSSLKGDRVATLAGLVLVAASVLLALSHV